MLIPYQIDKKNGLNVKRLLDHYTCVYTTKSIVCDSMYDKIYPLLFCVL